jgi:hypothetical protein
MRTLFICFLLFVCSYAYATQTVLSPELTDALNLLNDSQLIEAQTALQAYTEKNPDDPGGVFLLALTKWRMMWFSTYNTADRQDLQKMLERVKQLCGTETEDKDCMFFNASVTGIYAQLAATENRWWDTAQLGKKMKGQAEKILDVDSEYYPALYLLGSFNFFADALPGYIKFLRTFVFLPSGSRAAGLNQLNVAYTKGGVVSAEAGRTLAIIYTYFQRNPEYGEQMCDILLHRFPQAYDISLYKGINLYFDQSWHESLDQLRNLHSQLSEYSSRHALSKENAGHEREFISVYRSLDRETRYWIGRNLIQQEDYAAAKEIFMDLADPPVHQPYWLIRWVYLSLAQIEYHNHNDQAAQEYLEKVLAWKDVKDSTAKAKVLRKKHGQVDIFEIDVR